METELFIEIFQGALITTAIVSLPILLPGLVVGIVISIFQAVTQISEQTLSFVPKLFVMILSLLVAGTWLSNYLMDYTKNVITKMPEIAQPK